MKKKFLFISPTLEVGGAQQHMMLFANYLVENGYDVVLVNTSSNNDLAYRFDKRVEIISVLRKFNFDLGPAKKIAAIVKEKSIDRVFCDSIFTYLFVRPLLKIPGVKISVIFHLTKYVDNYSYIKDLVTRFLLNKKVQLIGISTNQIDTLSKVLFLPAKRFKLIYNGIDTVKFNFQHREDLRNKGLRNELNIPAEAFVIIKTARFAPEKNHELAIEVLEILRSRYSINAYMIFVGNTNVDRMDKIRKMADSKDIGPYVKMVGVKKDVRPFLAIADLFILSSKSVETFSIAALEAMALGLPAVITNLGGAKEMVSDGKNGYVTSYEDAETFAKDVVSVYNGSLTMKPFDISNFITESFNVESTNKQLLDFVS